MSGLREALTAAAEAPLLLVACDFDGTLSPIAPRPDAARPDPGALRMLVRISDLPHTHAAVVSGRGLTDLSRLMGPAGRVRLVGSHGAERDWGPLICVTPEGKATLAAVAAEVRAIAGTVPGSHVEEKPAGVAFHFRGADAVAARAAVDAVLAGPARREGVHVLRGHAVVELSVIEPDKGKALAAVRHRVGAASTIFIGDDTTDELAFGVLGPADVGIKIGPGATSAAYRIESQAEVSGLLEHVLAVRTGFQDRHRPTPIERHAMLSDQRTIALLDPRGCIVWLCLPRVDSTALFAALLGGEGAGFFSVEPVGGGEPKQEYAGDTFVLRTAWPGVTVTDYLDCSGGRPFQRAGRSDLVRVVEGSGKVALRFAPRPDFGRTPTRLVARDEGVEVDGWLDPIVLHSPGVRWSIHEHGQQATATAEVELAPGRPLVLELRYGTGNLRPALLPEPERRRQTERFWSGWVATLRIPEPHASGVRRSACVLKALCHGPTGAIVAAGTTSLPAPIGGIRNWDYRYCWPRDSCLAAAALLRLGNTGTAMKLLDWLVGVVDSCESPDRLRPIYTVTGQALGPEGEIGSLAGYGGSRPVRIGNAAANQVQLDVFGPIVDVVALLAEAGAPVTPQYWRLVEAMVQAVAARWREPDHGIWELRTHRRHNVHTKVMSWHAVNRGIAVAEHVLGRSRPGWASLRDQIAEDVLSNGWSPEAGAFTAAYGEHALDAAALAVGLTGLLPPSDPRFLATVDTVNRALRRGPAVHRYRFDDGLPGIEGGFNLCTAWLIESLALVGRADEARELLDAYAALAGPTGLMSEEYDPDTGLSLGNYPQAYSHLGLINAAVRLASL